MVYMSARLAQSTEALTLQSDSNIPQATKREDSNICMFEEEGFRNMLSFWRSCKGRTFAVTWMINKYIHIYIYVEI